MELPHALSTFFEEIKQLDISLGKAVGVTLAAYVTAVFLRSLFKHRKLIATYNTRGGVFSFVGPGPFKFLLPEIPYINRKGSTVLKEKYSEFAKAGLDIVPNVSYFPRFRWVLMVADPAVIKHITVNRADFPKPAEFYKALAMFGKNIVVTEDEEWRKHRRIAAPAFSERNNVLVHQETTRIVFELFEAWEAGPIAGCKSVNEDGNIIEVEDVRKITFDLALQVIAAAGFGYSVGWKEEESELHAGHKLTFKNALSQSLHDLGWRIFFADRTLNKFERGRSVITAYEELGLYMREMIQSRKEAPNVEKADLFSNLLDGATAEMDSKGIDESELMGNIYIFLVAGHETTAHTLAFTLGLLALHQDVQDRILQEFKSIVAPGMLPTYSDVCKMKYTEAVIYETLRQYPLVTSVPKRSRHDTVLRTSDSNGGVHEIPIQTGTDLMLNVIGLHYNDKYWPEPYKFKPERFLNEYNKDAFIPFSAGARSCVGRRFSEIEAISALALIVSQYHITVKEGSSFVEMNHGEPMIKAKLGTLTTIPLGVSLTFTKRK